MRITKRTIEALQPPKTGYQIAWDGQIKGFGVRITSTGTVSFIYQDRINGRDRRITLGRYPSITSEHAKKLAQRMAAEIADGKDPATERKTRRHKGVTLAEALQDYLGDRDLKPRTVDDIKRRMRRLSDWQTLPIKDITRDMVVARHRRIGEKTPASANAVMRYLRAVLNYAAEAYGTGNAPFLTDIPTRRLSATRSWYRVERRRTLIAVQDLPNWWKGVESLAAEDSLFRHGPEYRDYFQFVLLTGLRRGEAQGLTWENIDRAAGTITIRDTKNREPHVLPLTDYLTTIIKRREQRAKGPYVFATPDEERIDNWRYALEAVTKNSGVSFCIHDLRRTFATVAESLDLPAYAIKRLLNHKMGGDVTAGYIVITPERLRGPMQKITDYILKAAKIKATAKVVKLKRRGAP